MVTSKSEVEIYQLHVWIRQISPMIWRRLLVRNDSTIADLHYTLQIAFGWSDEHLHQFRIHGQAYGVYHDGGINFSKNPGLVKLSDFKFRKNERFIYEYDFGDFWEHSVRLEVLFALNTGARDDNVCGLKWQWEVKVPELSRSVFVIPSEEFKGKRTHVLILNDVAWKVVEACRGEHEEYVFVYRRERVKNFNIAPVMPYRRIETLNNTGWQAARNAIGMPKLRVHDLRHAFGQRLRDAGVTEEDRALLLGHAIQGMPQHYATATVARLVEAANSVSMTVDRTTLLRVVNSR